jgi:hypothetical protein
MSAASSPSASDIASIPPRQSSEPAPEKEEVETSEETQGDDDTKDTESNATSAQTETNPNPWQAIWSPQYNAYYFFNSQTQETTWSNPLEPQTEPPTDSRASALEGSTEQSSSSSAAATSSSSTAQTGYSALHAAAIAQGIDPSLAHLDPSLLSGSSNPTSLAFTAKFNARTGAFARPDARDPTHLSEFERAKRMSEFYFDVGAWETDLAQREAQEAEAGKKRKRPTKVDLERYKDQKKQKKLAKTAWLRS